MPEVPEGTELANGTLEHPELAADGTLEHPELAANGSLEHTEPSASVSALEPDEEDDGPDILDTEGALHEAQLDADGAQRAVDLAGPPPEVGAAIPSPLQAPLASGVPDAVLEGTPEPAFQLDAAAAPLEHTPPPPAVVAMAPEVPAPASEHAAGERRAPREERGRSRGERGGGRHREERGREDEKARARKSARIEDLLKVGQEVVVQVSKDPIGTKGARLTSHVSIPGRHLVFMPTVDHVGISRRISNEKERRRLRETVDRLRPPGTGFIVRTVAENVPQAKLESDIRFLIEIWNQVVAPQRAPRRPGAHASGPGPHSARHPRPLRPGRRAAGGR